MDTNILSEAAKPPPDAGVMAWQQENERHIYVSTITIGELRRGIERLPEGARKTKLRHWLQSLCDCLKGRILAFSPSSAHIWDQLKAKWDAEGLAVPKLDSQVAAIANRHGLTVVTRNSRNFSTVQVLSPFA